MNRRSISPAPTLATRARSDDASPVSHESSPGDATRLLELERSYAELRSQSEALGELVAMLGDGVVCTELDGTITYCNESASRMLGGNAKDWLGRSLFDWFPRSEVTRLFALYQAALDGRAQTLEWQDSRNTSSYLSVDVRLARASDGAGSPTGIVNVFRDVTERRRAEETTRRDSYVLSQLEDAVVCTDTELRVVYWNEAAERIFQWPSNEVLGRSILNRLPGEVHELVGALMREIAAGARVAPAEWEDFRKDGSRVWMQWRSQPIADDAGRPIGVVSVGTDISARRVAEQRKAELEAQLYQAQKMETMGMLSSGIAHDFNNILTAILIQSEVALADPETTARSGTALKEIRAAGLRAKALVRRILNFSRREEPEARPVDLRALLGEVVSFVRATLPPSIEIRFDAATNCRATLSDENRLHQVFVNLSSNAASAMARGGVLEFSLGEVELPKSRALSNGTLAPGQYVMASVSDNGSGMNAETVARVFEPFFTTKRAGEGTGLGLTIVASIVAQHGGAIQVDSRPGVGTKVTVFLPVFAGDEPVKATPTPPRVLPRGMGERILVLDDEESLALLMRATLETLGYRVTHATSALQVIAELEAAPSSFDLIVTDQNMPQLSGVELAQRARKIGVELPIVIATAFGAPLDARDADDIGQLVVLEKPFEVEHLARLVRRLLDAQGALDR